MNSLFLRNLPASLAALLFLPTMGISSVQAGSATWSSSPSSGDWNTPANWNPATVPNAQTDIATFATSAVTQVSLSSGVSLDSVIFNTGADSFSISATGATTFGFYGAGVVNDSGQTQQFAISNGGIGFYNSASAGDNTSYFVNVFSGISFYDSSTAGTANFTVQGRGTNSGNVFFSGGTAGNATFTVLPEGFVVLGDGTAGNATFNVAGGFLDFSPPESHGGHAIIDCSAGGSVDFSPPSTVDEAQVTVHGATGRKSSPGSLSLESDSAAQGTFVVEGGMGQQTAGGLMIVTYTGTLSDGSVTVTGGTSGGLGGSLVFRGKSDGGTAPISMTGNALLDFSRHDQGSIEVGSIAGAGTVILGAIPLSIGTNNLDTTFSGVIQDGDQRSGFGPLLKVGTGTLTLGGANTYAGGTTVNAGILAVANTIGSGTGSGAVRVAGGVLGGSGTIAGPVTVGAVGALFSSLRPSVQTTRTATLTIQSSLTFNSNGGYVILFNTKTAQADQTVANGVTIHSGTDFGFQTVLDQLLPAGTTFTIINNTASTPISGNFSNLPDGTICRLGRNNFLVNYEGGDGNDLTLTVQ